MLSTSRGLRNCNQKQKVSKLQRHFSPQLNCTGKCTIQKWRLHFNSGLLGILSGIVVGSCSLRVCRYHLNSPSKIYVASIPVGFAWMWPYFVVRSRSICSFKSMATHDSTNQLEDTEELLNQIISALEGSTQSSREICSYLDKLYKVGSVSALAKLLCCLHSRHIFLSPDGYDLLLEALQRGDDIELSLQIFKDLLISSKSLSSKSYFSLAKAFVNTSDYNLLCQFVREVSYLAFPRSTMVMNRIIYALAESGQTDKALVIFNDMKSMNCQPDVFTYNIVLEMLGAAGHLDDMLLQFSAMKEANIRPDMISYNTLFNNFRKLGRLDLCLMYVKEMGKDGIQPDLRTYTSLIESFGSSGNVEESLRLFDEMKHRQVRPSVYIYRSLVQNLKKLGELEAAASLLEEMNSSISNLVSPKDFKPKNR